MPYPASLAQFETLPGAVKPEIDHAEIHRAIGARAGGANVMKATLRVTFWGALAMALTAGIGALFGTVV